MPRASHEVCTECILGFEVHIQSHILESSVAFGEHWNESVRCEFLIYRMPFGGGGAAVELTLFLLKIECF